MDKIDPKKGYEPGNIMIVLWRMNDARCQFSWSDLLELRVLQRKVGKTIPHLAAWV